MFFRRRVSALPGGFGSRATCELHGRWPHPGAEALCRAGFARRLCPDCQGMNGACEFPRQRRVNHPMTLDPALPFEGGRHDIKPEMRFAPRPVAGMPLVQM